MRSDLRHAQAWLDSHLNWEAAAGGPPRAGSTGGLSLQRMEALVEVLGHPERACPVVHVTGTNGKGSTARMISALVAETGLTVGTYLSPHLQRINERISRNGESISDEDLARVLGDLEHLESLTGTTNSWFELITAAAFAWFAEVAVDVMVLEVGMLGRFDATNVADAAVAVLTNVGSDHTDFSGDWRAAIASEKAGIVKAESILVLGETDPGLLPIFYGAGAAEVIERERDFEAERNELAVGGRLLDLRTPSRLYEEVFLPLHGAHQGDNAAVALAAVEAFFGQPLDEELVQAGFAGVRVPGRFEIVHRDPLVILDGAHNLEGASVAAATLESDFHVSGDRILVVGMLSPRDPTALLDSLEAGQADLIVACTPPSPRAVPAQEVAAAAAAMGVRTLVEPDVARAVERAMQGASSDDLVLVTGSLYVVGAARDALVPG